MTRRLASKKKSVEASLERTAYKKQATKISAQAEDKAENLSCRERVFYPTDSLFPLSYKDNRMNLWYAPLTPGAGWLL